VAITQVAGFMAVPVTAILARLLVPTHFLMAGWRWVMVIGASGALLTWWFRRRLPESPRWLESRGLTAEADKVMRALEAESLSGIPLRRRSRHRNQHGLPNSAGHLQSCGGRHTCGGQ